MNKIKIFLVDDHQIVRDGIRALLINEEDIDIVGEASDCDELFDELKKITPDILILDITMPKMTGIEIIKILEKNHPSPKVIIFSGLTNEDAIFDSLRAGAKAFVPKDSLTDELLDAIHSVYEGKEFLSETISNTMLIQYIKKDKEGLKYSEKGKENLTTREIEIIKLFSEGYSYKEIADKLFISTRTVESHKNNIMQKLELRSTVDLVKFAIKQKIIEI